MRVKINEGNPGSGYIHRGTEAPNDIYRRFKRQFSILLNPDPTNRVFLDKVFVKIPSVIEELEDFADYQEDGYKCVIGLKGIGKTTLLRKVFETEGEVTIRENYLIAVINAESSERVDSSPQQQASLVFGAAVNRLKREYGYVTEKLALYDFIECNKPTLLEEARQTPDDTNEDIINNLFKINRRGYVLEELKLLLSHEGCPIQRVILILDNLEAILEWDKKRTYVKEALIDYECLKNRKNVQGTYFAKMIICGRPDSYYRFIRDQVFDTYPNRNEILLSNPPPIDEIFKARFDSLITRDGIKVEDKQEWQRAYDIMVDLAKVLSVHHKADILNLCNLNIRKAVNIFEKLLSNRVFFQRGYPLQAAFKLNHHYFTKEKSTITKALIYGNTRLYAESPENPVSNILRNFHNTESDIVPLYILAFGKNQRSKDGDHNYFRYVDFGDLVEVSDDIFPFKNAQQHFRDTIEHFLSHGLLMRGPWVKENEDKLCITPKADTMINMLKESTVLLNALRDDLWLETDLVTKPTDLLSEEDAYVEVASITKGYIEKEEYILDFVAKSGVKDRYLQLFGFAPVSTYVYAGFRESVHSKFKERIKKSLTDMDVMKSKIELISKELTGEG